MINSATLSTSNSVNRNYRGREIASGSDVDARNENKQQMSIETVAFTMMLDVARSIYVDPNQLSTTSPVSATQMFEPNASDSHESRQSEMHKQARADHLNNGLGRNDSTSIQARLTDQGSQQELDPSAKGSRLIGHESKLHQPAPSTQAQSNSALDAMMKPTADQSVNTISTVQAKSQEPQGRSESRLDSGSMRTPELTGTINNNQAITASAAASVRPATSGNASSSQIAQQVGQILATSRGGEVESARAVQSMQPSSDTRQKFSNSKSDASTLTKSSDHAKSSSPLETKGDSVSRSEFDQLVRSIRMKPGMWQSSAKIRLDPPSLGTLNIDIKIVGKKLEINVKTESREATKRISQQASKLISALEQHGISIERFDVSMEDASQQTPHEAESSLADASTQNRQESNDRAMRNSKTGESTELSDQQIENTNELELNTVAERRIDIKA